MAAFREASPGQATLLAQLVDAELLIPSGVPGVFGRSEAFESVLRAVDSRITAVAASDGAERLRFPPVLPREQLEAVGYLRSFPHLAGSIFGFEGSADDGLTEVGTDLVLTPAACYPVYPAIARRGPLPAGGVAVDAGGSYVFRWEPSGDPARLQMFHQREMVRIGEPAVVAGWRDEWRQRAVELLRSFGLDGELVVASDPFFGRAGRLLARSQRAQELKWEIQVPITEPEPTAVASFNYHQEHFTDVYGLAMEGGGVAHTACLGFGLERIVVALLAVHGLDVDGWLDAVAG